MNQKISKIVLRNIYPIQLRSLSTGYSITVVYARYMQSTCNMCLYTISSRVLNKNASPMINY